MPPGPSSPASIPSTRKTSSSGVPAREAKALRMTLAATSAAPTRISWFACSTQAPSCNGKRVEAAPQVPRRDRPPRRPRLADPGHLELRERLAGIVVKAHRALQADVVEREHVGTRHVENQEHLGGPAADAFHLRELDNQPFVVERVPLCRVERARAEALRKVEQIR